MAKKSVITITNADIIKQFRRKKPETVLNLLQDCKFTLKFLSDGSFRDVYHIVGTDYIVKVPKLDTPERNKEHARHEHKSFIRVKRSKKKYLFVQPYMPEFLYFDYSTGLAVMRKYKDIGSKKFRTKVIELDQRINDLHNLDGVSDTCDIDNGGNFAIDDKGKLVLIDLGCFSYGF